MSRLSQAYREAILDTDRELALRVVQDALASGIRPEGVVFEMVVPAIEALMSVGTRQDGVSLAQYYMAAQIGSEVVEAMVPRFASAPAVSATVVIGTAQGDFHALGKRIVAGCLRAMMTTVIDLGMNVPPHKFVSEALAHNASVIAISSMMMHTARGDGGATGVRRILREQALEHRIGIAVGGAPFRFDPELCARVGADTWAVNGIDAARAILALAREKALP